MAKRSLLLALIATPLPLIGDVLVAKAYEWWLSSPYTVSSWLLLFIAISFYYYLLAPLTLTVLAAHDKLVARKTFILATYIYLVFFLLALALYALGLLKPGIISQDESISTTIMDPYMLVAIGSLLSVVAGATLIYHEKLGEGEIAPTLLDSVKHALGALIIAWITWVAVLIALSTTKLSNMTLYDPGITLYYSYAYHSPWIQESITTPLLRVTISSLVARYLSTALLSSLLNPV